MLNRYHLLVGGAIGIVLCLMLLYSRRNKPSPVSQPPWPMRRDLARPPQPPTVVKIDTPPLTSPAFRPELPPRADSQSPYDPAFVPRSPLGESLDPFANASLVQSRPRSENSLVAVDESPVATEALRGMIRLRANDSLWLLAERAYGSGLYFKALYEHNRQRIPRPDQLQEGDEIEIPEPGDLAREFPMLIPRSDDRFRP